MSRVRQYPGQEVEMPIYTVYYVLISGTLALLYWAAAELNYHFFHIIF